MGFRRLLQHAIGLTWLLLILAGCRMPPEPSIASPSAAPADEQPTTSPAPELVLVEIETVEMDEVICTCEVIVAIEAYVDQNANGKREAKEEPLQGARFRLESWDGVRYMTSDNAGHAEGLVRMGCCRGFAVHAEELPGYRLTTPNRCGTGGCTFGFAALDVAPTPTSFLREADLHGADLQGEDLRDADLTGANLCEANLRGAKLRNAQLSGANLQGADLSGADLRGAILSKAQMSGAVLTEALLSCADLSNADLSRANLSQAHLSEADLHGADLQGANLNDASLRWANLSAANLNGTDLGKERLHKAKYDRNTKWPEDFDPVAAGAVLEE